MIIVIDDNEDLVDITCQMLRISGYEAIGVYNGKEGIERAKEIKPKLILCDIEMKDMNGYDVVRYIRKDPSLKDIYIVAISGYGEETDLQLSHELGFDLHLKKPIEFDQLLKVIKNLYKG